jgi:hypothetical protein
VKSGIGLLIFLFWVPFQGLFAQGQVRSDTLSRSLRRSPPDSLQTDSTSLADSTIQRKGVYSSTGKSDIETTIKYKSKDSIRFDVKKQVVTLIGEAEVNYGNLNITAHQIDISWLTNEVTATGTVDTAGKNIGTPIFKQGSEKYVAKTIRYNYNSARGLISDIVTQQGEGYIHGTQVKKDNTTDFYINDARYTTCNLAEPHFEIHARRIKMIKDKKIVTGPFNLQIENVPTPFGFGFGMFPTSNKTRVSGVIIPSYGEAQDRGFFLRDGGYYFGFSDYFDAKIMGEIYTKGGFGLNNVFRYRKRYHYDGNLNLRYVKRPDPAFDLDEKVFIRDVWFTWAHNPVQRGNDRFSANVQLGSVKFNQRNAFQTGNFLSNNFQSSVSYFTTFPGTPFNLAINANQSQNTATRIMNVDLPNISFNMNQIQPFRKKTSAGTAWYEKIRMSYRNTAAARFSNAPKGAGFSGIKVSNAGPAEVAPLPITTRGDTLNLIISRANYGMAHEVPISSSFRILKHFSVNPTFTYRERWSPRQLNFGQFNPTDSSIRVDTISGFRRNYDYSFNTNFTTQLYGFFKFGRNGPIEAIRHKILPTFGFVYSPDFGDQRYGFFQNRQVNGKGDRQNLNTFEGTLYGGTGRGRSQSLTFDIANQLEMKLSNRKDTSQAKKKVPLIENFGFNGAYNFAADSGRLSNINFNARTSVLGKLTIAFNGTLNPYFIQAISSSTVNGVRRVEQYRSQSIYAWNRGQGLGQVTNYSLVFGTNLNPDTFKSKNKKKPAEKEKPPGVSEEEWRQIKNNPERYVDFTLPWSLNLNYNLNYSKIGFEEKRVTQTMNFAGDIRLTEKWKVGFTSGFDFVAKNLSFTSVNIFRDLHCWQMRLDWIPLGPRQSFEFNINVKSSLLQDLKLSKRNNWYDR